MIGAYVLGRPMPSFSRALTSEASVYRAGGLVKCCSGRMSTVASGWPTCVGGSCCSVEATGQTLLYPSKTRTRPAAL